VLQVLARRNGDREQEAAVELSAIHAKQVDLGFGVGGTHISVRREAYRCGVDDHRVLARG
jgi:hypothetical protein